MRKMTKQIFKVFLVLVITVGCTLFISHSAEAHTLNHTSLIMEAGSTKALKISGVKASKIKWTTSNKKVAAVSKSGKVTAGKCGTATVKARYKGVTYSCKIKVQIICNKVVLVNNSKVKITLVSVRSNSALDRYVIKYKVQNKTDRDWIFGLDYLSIDGADTEGFNSVYLKDSISSKSTRIFTVQAKFDNQVSFKHMSCTFGVYYSDHNDYEKDEEFVVNNKKIR